MAARPSKSLIPSPPPLFVHFPQISPNPNPNPNPPRGGSTQTQITQKQKQKIQIPINPYSLRIQSPKIKIKIKIKIFSIKQMPLIINPPPLLPRQCTPSSPSLSLYFTTTMSFRTLPPPPNPNTTTNNAVAAFKSFFEGWLVRQEHYLDELLSSQQTSHESRESDLKELIARVLSHYQQYYEEKSILANRDIFLVFSPTWFTPFERTFFWIAGFKPGLTFRLVNNAVTDLTEEQKQRIGVLVAETKAGERELGEELARIQESVAASPIVELARREGRGGLRDGEVDEASDVLEALKAAMERVVGRADLLRTRTAEKMVEVLSPVQNVRFLTAATQLQQRIRIWGLQKEGKRRGSSGSGWHW